MNNKLYTNSDIRKIFGQEINRQTLINAEVRGKIPKATKAKKGSNDVRHWTLEDLPQIGEIYGFLKGRPKQTEVICVYTAKGGVLKTTLSYTLARVLALHNIKVLIVGLDIQGSITEMTLSPLLAELDEVKVLSDRIGVGDFITKSNISIDQIIHHTGLPTLDIIPETPQLSPLERHVREKKRREYVLQKELIKPLMGRYDVIIFDNGPGWNMLVENALTAASTVISPTGCRVADYQAVETNMNTVLDFQDEMGLTWKNFHLVPTLVNKTKMSQEILDSYINDYSEHVTKNTIRCTVKGEESVAYGKSIIEYDGKSGLATDYIELAKEIWEKII